MTISDHSSRAGGGTLTDPVRYPANAPAPVRTKRAFVLLLLTLLVPGSAQIVAGDRKLGRLALRITFTVWALAILALVMLMANRTALINIITNPITSLLIILVLVALAIGWLLLFLNTLRIIRPVLLAPGMRPIVGVALLGAMIISSGTLGYSAYLLNVSRNAIGSIFNAGGPAIDPVDGRYNFLMMGGDAGDDRTGRRPDSLSVISVDAKTGESAIISVPRNLQNAQFSEGSPMRDIYPDGYNCGDECLINAINTEVTEQYADLYPDSADPGAQATMEAVSGSLGITVQAYVLVDMDGFAKLIDAMGGIRIKAGGWVPMSGYKDESTGTYGMPEGWIAAGENHLNGHQALWYGRSREYVDDFARISRQQCVQQAMLKQLDPATLLAKFEDIAGAGTKVVESNISAGQLGSFVDLAIKAKDNETRRLTIGPPDFEPHFSTVPDFDVIHERVRQLLTEASGTPAAAGPANTAGKGADALVDYAGPAGHLSAQGLPAELKTPLSAPLTATPEDFTPVTHTPDGELITAEMLNGLKSQGNELAIQELVASNGQCAPL
ncbi:LCP family protein [Pseudarthrobacter sp. J75]|uniref:LCP family protein n=1 Tax=unclassified Pseudarthrobacter TaxID=2647000 RepID=UPI002E82357F|nr:MULTISPECIES: LCP family protein [unclassified Pseudarthrobacter]MEE2521628.1 LCP family protein [Pseudarthrobacter sp. J47]MEE2527705.1 LCP family protein [Pseudarthrobacter sp. J75]MEE2570902.1 LCP family protein [Pseudarthrobacter sp. J64]